MKHYIKLMRPHHYLKNVLVFAALACSGQLFQTGKFLSCLLAFVAFCMISSVVYIINDICDADKDRLHPTKCRRPIAAGLVSPRQAKGLAVALVCVAALCNSLIFAPLPTLLLVGYLVLNLLYSFGLKNVPILDITILTCGFLIRVVYGALVTDIAVSSWLYLTVMALAFYLSLGKRRNELRQHGDSETRKVLKGYPLSFLDKSMNMCLTLAIMFYSLWSMDANTVAAYSVNLVVTVPIVLLIVMKYNLNIEGDSDGDPVEVLLGDKILLILCAVYLLTMFWILYIK